MSLRKFLFYVVLPMGRTKRCTRPSVRLFDCPSLLYLRFSRNTKATEASKLVET